MRRPEMRADKVARIVDWVMRLPDPNRENAVRALVEHAVITEWIDVHDGEPYFTTCREPLDFCTGDL